MVDLSSAEIKIIDKAFQTEAGYVLDFTNKTFEEFFAEELKIEIYSGKYNKLGDSKMKRLRCFCKVESSNLVVRALKLLWEYRGKSSTNLDEIIEKNLFALIQKLEGSSNFIDTEAIEEFFPSETLELLVASIKSDIEANRPEAALDRLHTYCSKKFGHLLTLKNIDWSRDEPLHSRVGKYAKYLKDNNNISELSLQIIRNSNSIFDKFNNIRNNYSLAHDNTLLSNEEATYIFESICSLLKFVKQIELGKFE